jgi:hypothetical protein
MMTMMMMVMMIFRAMNGQTDQLTRMKRGINQTRLVKRVLAERAFDVSHIVMKWDSRGTATTWMENSSKEAAVFFDVNDSNAIVG